MPYFWCLISNLNGKFCTKCGTPVQEKISEPVVLEEQKVVEEQTEGEIVGGLIHMTQEPCPANFKKKVDRPVFGCNQ